MSHMMLTTLDNPYDPFKHFDEWWNYDHNHGYYCCEYLSRVAAFSDDLPDADQDEALEEAIREIVLNNPTQMYTIAFEEGYEPSE